MRQLRFFLQYWPKISSSLRSYFRTEIWRISGNLLRISGHSVCISVPLIYSIRPIPLISADLVLWRDLISMFLFCLVFAMFCARLFICALWSPAGKELTSWLSFVVSSVSLSLSHWYPGSGVVLDCIDS